MADFWRYRFSIVSALPGRPSRKATISDTMLRAISSGVLAPMSSPMGGVNGLEPLQGDAVLEKLLVYQDGLPLAAHQNPTYPAGLRNGRLQGPKSSWRWPLVATTTEVLGAHVDLLQALGVIGHYDAVRLREPVHVGEFRPVVHHPQAQSQHLHQRSQRLPDVASTGYDHSGWHRKSPP